MAWSRGLLLLLMLITISEGAWPRERVRSRRRGTMEEKKVEVVSVSAGESVQTPQSKATQTRVVARNCSRMY